MKRCLIGYNDTLDTLLIPFLLGLDYQLPFFYFLGEPEGPADLFEGMRIFPPLPYDLISGACGFGCGFGAGTGLLGVGFSAIIFNILLDKYIYI